MQKLLLDSIVKYYRYQSVLIILISSSLLLAIWSLPGTIALRNILLVLGATTSLIYIYHTKSKILSYSSWPLAFIVLFFVWVILHIAFLANEHNPQVAEFKGLWLRTALAVLLGLALGLLLTRRFDTEINQVSSKFSNSYSLELELSILFFGLAGYTIISMCYLFDQILASNTLPIVTPNNHINWLYKLYKAKTPFVIGNAFFLPFCLALVFFSLKNHANFFWAIFGSIGLTVALLITVLSNTKNGFAIFALAIALFGVNLILKGRWLRKNIKTSLVIAAVLISFFYLAAKLHVNKNPEWFFMLANAKVGLDIKNHDQWRTQKIDSVLLTNEFGKSVDPSTYERSSWFAAGLILLAENPLGFGLTHHSFGKLAIIKWPDFSKEALNARGATHSGWLDFALGMGIPGVLLVWISLLVSWYRSFYYDGIWFSYTAWTIPIMWVAYFISEANGEHFIELMFFMTSFFCGATLFFPAINNSKN
jgi:hypothetical protein